MILVRMALEHRRTLRRTLAKDRTTRMIPPKLLKVLLQTAAMVPEIRALLLTLQEVEVMMKVMAVMMETRKDGSTGLGKEDEDSGDTSDKEAQEDGKDVTEDKINVSDKTKRRTFQLPYLVLFYLLWTILELRRRIMSYTTRQ
jgi:hypothetical protein